MGNANSTLDYIFSGNTYNQAQIYQRYWKFIIYYQGIQMKRIILLLLASAFFLPSVVTADQWVNGYTRSDGTYVQGYNRSSPNNTVRDNFSYDGNTNPYTGNTGTNKYYDNPTSEYYRGGSQSYGNGGTLYGR